MALFLMLMGPQGAGKGVQAQLLSAGLKIPHVSTGDLFRAMRQREDELAREGQAVMATGRLIDDALTNEVLRDRLEQPDAKAGAVLDGYPRNLVQAEFLSSIWRAAAIVCGWPCCSRLDLYEAFRRTYGRITATDSRSYNIYGGDAGVEWEFVEHPERAYPPQLRARLLETGEALLRRPDDAHAHAIIQRIEAFLALKQELVGYYEARGILFRIDAAQEIEAVAAQIADVIASAPVERSLAKRHRDGRGSFWQFLSGPLRPTIGVR